MDKDDLIRRALELPLEEQLDVAQALWSQASPPPDGILSDDLQTLLEARLLEARQNPEAGVTWEEMKVRLGW
ncbi:MAG TPA: addiction module protein [Thermoanaerobaculia bacterium]|nr:addiction module protein [Thermoanaerobaculia bacterium]